MPSDVDKAIYLDCDVVVNDDLGELWDTELGEKSLLAARDLIGWVSDPNAGISNFRELGIPGDAKYFNAGVLVLNLAKWRSHGTTERLCKYLKDYQAVIRAADQEALNAVLFHEWGELNFRWNWQVIARYYRIGTHKMGWSPPITKKSIIHFHSSEKPWLPGCDYEERKLFFEYLDRTEWAGWRVPLLKECYERSVRPLSDLRNAFGRFRRKHKLRI
jgi:lipopolysaccharide biosynthesis glycosyltransferase